MQVFPMPLSFAEVHIYIYIYIQRKKTIYVKPNNNFPIVFCVLYIYSHTRAYDLKKDKFYLIPQKIWNDLISLILLGATAYMNKVAPTMFQCTITSHLSADGIFGRDEVITELACVKKCNGIFVIGQHHFHTNAFLLFTNYNTLKIIL